MKSTKRRSQNKYGSMRQSVLSSFGGSFIGKRDRGDLVDFDQELPDVRKRSSMVLSKTMRDSLRGSSLKGSFKEREFTRYKFDLRLTKL